MARHRLTARGSRAAGVTRPEKHRTGTELQACNKRCWLLQYWLQFACTRVPYVGEAGMEAPRGENEGMAGGGEAFSFAVGEQPLDIAFHPTRNLVSVGADDFIICIKKNMKK